MQPPPHSQMMATPPPPPPPKRLMRPPLPPRPMFASGRGNVQRGSPRNLPRVGPNAQQPSGGIAGFEQVAAFSQQESRELKSMLETLDGTKVAIQHGKDWVLARGACATAIAEMIEKEMGRMKEFRTKLFVLYMVNDILFDVAEAQMPDAIRIRNALQSKIVVLLTFAKSAATSSEDTQKLVGLVDLWKSNGIFSKAIINMLESISKPEQKPGSTPLLDLNKISVGLMASICAIALRRGCAPYAPINTASLSLNSPPVSEPARLGARISDYYRKIEPSHKERSSRPDDRRRSNSRDRLRDQRRIENRTSHSERRSTTDSRSSRSQESVRRIDDNREDRPGISGGDIYTNYRNIRSGHYRRRHDT